MKLAPILLCLCCIADAAGQTSVDSLRQALLKVRSDTERLDILHDLTRTWVSINLDSAVSYGLREIRLADALHRPPDMWMAYHNTAYAYYLKSSFTEALDYFWKAIDALNLPEAASLPEVKKRSKRGSTIQNIGLVYFGVGDYPKALSYHLQALSLETQSGDDVSGSEINIANVYNAQSDWEKALRYYQQALAHARQAGNVTNEKICVGNIGIVYYRQKNYSEALTNYRLALKLATSDHEDLYAAAYLNNIGTALTDIKEYDSAASYFQQALTLSTKNGSKENKMVALGGMGTMYLQMKQYASAKRYLLEAVALSRAAGLLNQSMELETNLSSLYEQTKEYRQAFLHQASASAIRDSLFTIGKANEISGKVMSYEFEKKQAAERAAQERRDILAKARLGSERTLRNSFAAIGGVILLMSGILFLFYKRKRDAQGQVAKSAAALRISETELKSLRLQMNPHFINNALQSIQYFIGNHQPDEAEEYLVKFSSLMRAVLENSEQELIPLSEELQTLEWYMQLERLRMKHPFSYEMQIDSGLEAEEPEVPPNILQPFVENAIKHGLSAKSEPGRIIISCEKIAGGLLLRVEDNGVGRSSSNENGNDAILLKRKSLGIKITKDRLRIIRQKGGGDASVRIIDLQSGGVPAGTRVELKLPLYL